MSCLLFNCGDKEKLSLIDKYKNDIISLCVNILKEDIYDDALKYIISTGLPGEVVQVSDIRTYVENEPLDIYKTDRYILVNDNEEKVVEISNEDAFALAEKFKSENNREEAMRYYSQIVYDEADRYNSQQKYLSCLNLGILTREETKRVGYFLTGISFDHERTECYYELVVMENCRGNHKKGAFYGLQCPVKSLTSSREIDQSKPQINHVVHKYLFDLNLGVACYYAGLKREGYYATLRAIEGAINERQRKIATDNLKFYNDIHMGLSNKADLMVVDNFYENAEKLVGDFFLGKKFTIEMNDHSYFILKPKNGYFSPTEKLSQILDTEIGNIEGEIHLKGGYMGNWVNYTLNDSWNIIVFLQPQAKGSALELLTHIPTGESLADEKTVSVIERDVYDDTAWRVDHQIREKFNRGVIYRGNRYYRFTKYYNGSGLDSYMCFFQCFLEREYQK